MCASQCDDSCLLVRTLPALPRRSPRRRRWHPPRRRPLRPLAPSSTSSSTYSNSNSSNSRPCYRQRCCTTTSTTCAPWLARRRDPLAPLPPSTLALATTLPPTTASTWARPGSASRTPTTSWTDRPRWRRALIQQGEFSRREFPAVWSINSSIKDFFYCPASRRTSR